MILRLMKQGNGAAKIKTPRTFSRDTTNINPGHMPGFAGNPIPGANAHVKIDYWFKGEFPTVEELKAFRDDIRTRMRDQISDLDDRRMVCFDEEKFDEMAHAWAKDKWNGRTDATHRVAVIETYKAIVDGLHDMGFGASFWGIPRIRSVNSGLTPKTLLDHSRSVETTQIETADMIVVAAYWGNETREEFLYAVGLKMAAASISANGRPIAFCTVPLGKHNSKRAWRPIPTSVVSDAFAIAQAAGATEGWLWVNGSQNGILAPIYNVWLRYRAWRLARRFGGGIE